RITRGLSAEFREEASPVLQETQKQLEAYFHRELEQFSLPLLCVGTDFQQQVWQALQTIPYGSTESYLGLSKQLGNPKAIRAVASANGANALAIIIPCHRIIGSGQELVGYAGGIGVKKRLLALEQQEQLSLFEDLK
ncbi:MAG: methylated-DNA--[protein]-cysteine S-methyltransferase, partial [Flavobacterium sp.]